MSGSGYEITIGDGGSIDDQITKLFDLHYPLAHVYNFTDSLQLYNFVDYTFVDTPWLYHAKEILVVGEIVEWLWKAGNKVNSLDYLQVGETVTHEGRFELSKLLKVTSDSSGVFDQVDFRYFRTVFGLSENPNIGDNVNYERIRLNNLVYDIKHDSFTKFADIKVRMGYPLIKGSTTNNVVLLLAEEGDEGGMIKRFPGEGEPNYASVRTKDYFIEHGVFQAYNINYEQSSPAPVPNGQITTITKNADSLNQKSSVQQLSNMKPNKWSGYFPGAGYGFIGSLLLKNIHKVKDLILKYKIRLGE